MFLLDLGRDRTHVDEDGPLRHRLGDAKVEQNVLHRRSVGNHADHDIRVPHRRCSVGGDPDAGLGGQRFRPLGRAIPDRHREVGFRDMPGHVPTHQTDTKDCDTR